MSELTFLSAASMAQQIREKKISPVDLAEAHLAKIARLNPNVNAFVHVDSDRVRSEARGAETAVMSGETLGTLHGVPISIKSSLEVAGLRCESGTRLRAAHVATEDAPLVARLRQAGAIILGVTNTPELLMAWETDNLLYGRTNSPWDLERTAGGSSGGEAAAIAAGMSAGGVGSDGGGSIRVPAHFSGICGLKPTPGRIPATGHFPASGGPFALIGVVGPMARTVGDVKALFEIMQGPDDGDTCAAPVPLRWPTEDETKQLRVGYFEDDGRTPVTPETRAAVRTAAKALRDAGFQVEPFRPESLEEARVLWKKFFVSAGGTLIRPMFHGRERDTSPILRQFLDWSAAEPPLTGEGLLEAWIGRDALRARIPGTNEKVSHSAVSGGCDSCLSPRGTQLDDRRQDGRISRCLELCRVVQSAGKSRGCGSRQPFWRGFADRRTDRWPALGRRTGADGRGRAGAGMRRMENPAHLLDVQTASIFALFRR